VAPKDCVEPATTLAVAGVTMMLAT
jgi:hypothetical protein